MFWLKWILVPTLLLALGGAGGWFVGDHYRAKIALEGIQTRNKQASDTNKFLNKKLVTDKKNEDRRKAAREALDESWLDRDADPQLALYCSRLFP